MSVSISDLERGLSKARLQPYRNVTANDTDALCMYMRNMELSYGLYPVLQSVEVALRNGIHDAGVQAFQAADWFRDSAILPLKPREQRILETARDNVWDAQGCDVRAIRQGRIAAPPLPAVDDHIAALTFGFWTGMMNAPYTNLIWNTRPGKIDLAQVAFKYAGRNNRKSIPIFLIVNRLRLLRNRISHHEPILNRPPPLNVAHQEALQILQWISPSMHSIVMMTDPFPKLWGQPNSHHAPNLTVGP